MKEVRRYSLVRFIQGFTAAVENAFLPPPAQSVRIDFSEMTRCRCMSPSLQGGYDKGCHTPEEILKYRNFFFAGAVMLPTLDPHEGETYSRTGIGGMGGGPISAWAAPAATRTGDSDARRAGRLAGGRGGDLAGLGTVNGAAGQRPSGPWR